MESSSGGLSDRGSILGYLLTALVGVVASVLVPATAPVIGMMFLTFGLISYRSRDLPRLTAVVLIVAGAGIVSIVLYTALFVVKVN